MPQSKQHGSSGMANPDDWGMRALAIATALDSAAEELRLLIENFRDNEAATQSAQTKEEGLEDDA